MRRPLGLGIITCMAVGCLALASRAAGQQAGGGKEGQHHGHNAVVLEKVEGTSLTVKGEDGASKVVQIDATTPIRDSVSSDKSALKAGEAVRIWGAKNADGTLTAKRILLGDSEKRPSNRGGDHGDAVSGTVESVDPLKVKDDAGQIVAVTLDTESRISQMLAIALTDLKPGDRLMMRSKEGDTKVTGVVRIPEGAFQRAK